MDKGRIIQDGPPREILCKMVEDQDAPVTLPPIMELMNFLNRRGWRLAPDILSVDDAGRELQWAIHACAVAKLLSW
jgi:hypothetical protein